MFSSLLEKFVLTNVIGIVEDWSFFGQSIPSWRSIHLDTITKYSKKKLTGSIKTRTKRIVVVFAFSTNFQVTASLPKQSKRANFQS